MSQPTVSAFFDEATFTATYVVADPVTAAAVIVDPVLDFDASSARTSTTSADQLLDFVKEKGLDVQLILDTHVHADHLTAAHYLREQTGAKTAIGSGIANVQRTFAKIYNAEREFRSDGSQFDVLLDDDEKFQVGELQGRAIHTPGHTPVCMVYVIGDAAFVGDTLFMPDAGTARCDFPGGDAHTLYRSIQKIFALPAQTRLFICHDYKAPGRDQYAWETTVAEQRANNIQVRDGVGEDEFVTMRQARDATLSMPRLILPSVQVNMRAGEMPPAEADGVSYLKLPVNAF